MLLKRLHTIQAIRLESKIILSNQLHIITAPRILYLVMSYINFG